MFESDAVADKNTGNSLVKWQDIRNVEQYVGVTCAVCGGDVTNSSEGSVVWCCPRGELSYLAPLGSENISAPYFKQCFFQRGGGVIPPRLSQTPRLPVPRQK